MWEKEKAKLDTACRNKFRADNDIGNALCRYWQILSGNFSPTRKIGKYFIMGNNNNKIVSSIKQRKYKIICINDAQLGINFEKARDEINEAFKLAFPEKCSFEI